MILWQDTVTGFILAGIGHRNVEGQNFLIVKPGEQAKRQSEPFFYSHLYRESSFLIENIHIHTIER